MTLKFGVGTGLVLEGNLHAEGITFTDAGQGWDGIAVAGGTLDLDGVTVRDAAVGVTVYQPGTATISGSDLIANDVGLEVLSDQGTVVNAGSRINDNGSGLADHAGVRTGVPDDVTGTHACAYPCRSVLTLRDSEVSSNDGPGILALDADVTLDGMNVLQNAASGLTVSDATVLPVFRSCIESNGSTLGAHGVSVLAAGDFFMSQPQQIGENRIAYSERDELHISSGGYAFVGASTAFGVSGQNAIFDANTTDHLVFNGNNVGGKKNDVQAFDTWWGAGQPPAGAFYPAGSVDFHPPLPTDPTVGVCTPGQLRAPSDAPETSRVGARASAGRSGMEPAEAGRGGFGELRAAIRAVRAAIALDPAADSSAGLVGRLYGLHKLDRGDGLGERAATRGFLTALRARLNTPSLPAGLRATAEAAVTAGVLDALTLGEHGRAAQLLASWGERVEGTDARRVLGVAEAHLAAATGDDATAAAFMAAAAEGEPDEAARQAMLTVAAVYAGRAGAAARGGVPGNGAAALLGAAASRSGDAREGRAEEAVALSVYPNPSSGAATVIVTLGEEAHVRAVVFDVLGREVAVLADDVLAPGRHDLRLDGGRLPTGAYLVRVESGERRLSERITLLR